MKPASKSAPQVALLDQRMGRLGMELLMKAGLCAATMAVVAGMLAALVGA
jgi:hypothetical protein